MTNFYSSEKQFVQELSRLADNWDEFEPHPLSELESISTHGFETSIPIPVFLGLHRFLAI